MVKIFGAYVHCQVCGHLVDKIVQHDDGSTLRFYARCHGEQEEFSLPLCNEVVRVFGVEASISKATQTRHDHAVKRRTFLSAKRNGWRGETK